MKDKIIKSKAVITADMLSSTDTTIDELLSKDVCEAQIEQMARIIDDRLLEANGVIGSMNNGKGYWIAQKLVEHYQPKIPEGSVVLNSEQYSNYLITQTNNEFLKEQAEKLKADNERLYKNIGKFKDIVSKETAEKIFNALYKDTIRDGIPAVYNMLTPKKIKDMAKQFGVEIKGEEQ